MPSKPFVFPACGIKEWSGVSIYLRMLQVSLLLTVRFPGNFGSHWDNFVYFYNFVFCLFLFFFFCLFFCLLHTESSTFNTPFVRSSYFLEIYLSTGQSPVVGDSTGMANSMCRWCMLLLRVSRLWSILNQCLFQPSCVVTHAQSSNTAWDQSSVLLNILAAKWNLLTLLSQTPAVCVSETSCARGVFCLLINPKRISRLSACSVVPWIHVKF